MIMTLKRTLLTLLFSAVCLIAAAQASYIGPDGKPADGPVTAGASSARVRAYIMNERLGYADTVAPDTAIVSYMDNNPVNNYALVRAWNGNLGSPLKNMDYFRRKNLAHTFFSEPYNAYLITPENVRYFDTRKPYAKLVWHSSVPKYHEEEYLRALFTMNANRHFNVGGTANLVYGRGQYASQTARAFNGGIWASLTGLQYGFHAMLMFNSHKNYDHGGITDDDYVLHPENFGSYRSYNIPTVFNNNAYSQYRNNVVYLNHHYSLGFHKERKLENDSVVTDFVPVTSFVHTLRYDGIRRRFKESSIVPNFYDETYYTPNQTRDSLRYGSLRNTFAVVMEEKFMKKVGFGLAAFVEHELRRYDVMTDTMKFMGFYDNHLRVGATIARNEAKWVKFSVTGKIDLLGPRAGEFDLNGRLNTQFKIKNDTVQLNGYGSFERATPDYFFSHYNSNHFRWENEFQAYYDLRFGASVGAAHHTSKSWGYELSAGFNMSNLTNPVFFNTKAMPDQFVGNVQLMSIDAKLNLKAWKFHLDNQAVLQTTSNSEVIALPLVSLYSNVYYMDKFFKVLTMQLGMSLRYNTAYYAPKYMAATGVFYNQNEMEIGNYPEMNAYVNFHLKRMRFFALVTNWNQKVFGGRRYFSMPHYPINPTTFHFGLSWTFYD